MDMRFSSSKRRRGLRAGARALTLGLLLLGCGREQRTSVVLITVDTLRADRLGCYGYRLPTSPHLDAFAENGVRFADCTVQWPKTLPSMASMMTGSHPKTLGITRGFEKLSDELIVLGEVFQGAGYRTAAVVANFNVGTFYGFDQGFDHFVEAWRDGWEKLATNEPFRNDPVLLKRFTDARRVSAQALQWLRAGRREQPFFLWLHYMEPHGPYLPPAEYADEFAGEYPPEPTPLEKLPRYQVQLTSEGHPITDLAHYRAQYDREVRYFDDEFGRLLDQIRTEFGEDTLVILTADHGESFAEHDYHLEHGKYSYQTCAHIPLILSRGTAPGPGKVIEQPVGLIDLPPTLLDLAGIPIPRTFEGRSLKALIDYGDVQSAPGRVYMESGSPGRATQLTIREQRWKLIQVRAPEDQAEMTGEPLELYDLEQDPGELRNLAAEQPERAARLFATLKEWYLSRPHRPTTPTDLDDLSPQERDMLRSLGYID